jgi:hypothetical protein
MFSKRTDRRQFLTRSTALSAAGLMFGTSSASASSKKVAAIVTAYHRYSHADDIVTRFMEGYSIVGKSYPPPCKVASLYLDQTPETDIGRPLAKHWKIPLVKTIADALTLGDKSLAVDGVLLVAEHGDYPFNKKGQKLYPRRRFFEEIVKVFRATGRSVPVYVDKHLSYSWDDARWMYDQSRKLKFPMMAGSSVPVAYRRPDLRPKSGVVWENALSVGYGHFEILGFHALEGLQVMVERRRGGETGVRAVQCLEGAGAWAAAKAGKWDRKLLDAALARTPVKGRGELEKEDAAAHVFLIEYRDGLRASVYISPRHVSEFAFAGRVKGEGKLLACWYELPKPQRDHFSFLVQHIARMFTTGKASYPVERTLLTTGMLAFLMDSKAAGDKRIETPQLQIKYRI